MPRYGEIAGVTGDAVSIIHRMRITVRGEDGSGALCDLTVQIDVYTVPSPTDIARPHIGYIGRDFLRYVRLDYNGRTGAVRLIDESRP